MADHRVDPRRPSRRSPSGRHGSDIASDIGRRAAIAAGAAGGLAALSGCLNTFAHVSDDDDEAGEGALGQPADAIEVRIADMPTPGFEPPVAHVDVGGTVRWITDGYYHTVSAYHPDVHGPRRVPEGVDPFDSGPLREGEEFAWTFEREGVYDYADAVTLCATHEALGAVGRIVVGWPDVDGEPALDHDVTALPGEAAAVMRAANEETRSVL
ncbi:halocyanin [Halovivax sp.]|uniref:cupredoxin domain-containing protein n=1 Tax=Halovivax sp. TaxID=1935978 RepID=UPI0025BE02B6|nr:halocyanin [Halovivax sp.]